MKKILSDIKVVDLTRVLAGPYCTMILADMGAEVIKIERPGTGDDSRQFGPFVEDVSAYFMSINRNKKSITIDLKTEKGKKILKNLVSESDILVENFRPGTMERLGLGYDELSKVNEKLIYAACSGFGHTGPYSLKPAYDLIVQGLGGIMSITGQPDGIPTKVGASIGDIFAGVFTAIGILGALRFRDLTGKGQKIDVAMLDCQVAILENAIARYFATGKSPKPIGNRHPSIAPFEAFTTKDDYIIIAIGNDSLWDKFCDLIGREDLQNNPKFKTNRDRVKYYDELYHQLNELFITKTTREWLELLDPNGIPCAPINDIEKVVYDPQIVHRKMLVEVDRYGKGKFVIPALPIKFSETPAEIEKAAPSLGEDTEYVLKTYLNMTNKEIKQLKEEKVI